MLRVSTGWGSAALHMPCSQQHITSLGQLYEAKQWACRPASVAKSSLVQALTGQLLAPPFPPWTGPEAECDGSAQTHREATHSARLPEGPPILGQRLQEAAQPGGCPVPAGVPAGRLCPTAAQATYHGVTCAACGTNCGGVVLSACCLSSTHMHWEFARVRTNFHDIFHTTERQAGQVFGSLTSLRQHGLRTKANSSWYP
jgi:hypothetical protein